MFLFLDNQLLSLSVKIVSCLVYCLMLRLDFTNLGIIAAKEEEQTQILNKKRIEEKCEL